MGKYNIVTYKDREEIVEDITGDPLVNEDNWLEKLEESSPDSSFYFDVDFDSLLETLEYNGITTDQIKKLNDARYGNYVDFMYIKKDEMYLMEVGAR